MPPALVASPLPTRSTMPCLNEQNERGEGSGSCSLAGMGGGGGGRVSCAKQCPHLHLSHPLKAGPAERFGGEEGSGMAVVVPFCGVKPFSTTRWREWVALIRVATQLSLEDFFLPIGLPQTSYGARLCMQIGSWRGLNTVSVGELDRWLSGCCSWTFFIHSMFFPTLKNLTALQISPVSQLVQYPVSNSG